MKSIKAIAAATGLAFVVSCGTACSLTQSSSPAHHSDPDTYVWFNRTSGKITRVANEYGKTEFNRGYTLKDVRKDWWPSLSAGPYDLNVSVTSNIGVNYSIDGKPYKVYGAVNVVEPYMGVDGIPYYNKNVARTVPSDFSTNNNGFNISLQIAKNVSGRISTALHHKAFPAFVFKVTDKQSVTPSPGSTRDVIAMWHQKMSALQAYIRLYNAWPSSQPYYVFACTHNTLGVANGSAIRAAAKKLIPESTGFVFEPLVTPQVVTTMTAQPCDVETES